MSRLSLSTKQGEVPPVCARIAAQFRFAQARRFITPLNKIIASGLATKKSRTTPLGRAMSHLLLHCMEGEYPDIRVNPAKVRLSEGSLPGPDGIQLLREGTVLKMKWKDRPLGRPSYDDDIVQLCAYNPELGLACINEQETIRAEKAITMPLADGLTDERVHVYVITYTWDKKRFSRSRYLGEF